jgi:hypothetical protein
MLDASIEMEWPVSDKSRSRIESRRQSPMRSNARRLFGPGMEAGARAYLRARDLPRILPLWPHELEDFSAEGRLRLLAKLRRALRTERRLAASGHGSYDLNRHLGLLSAYKGELAALGLSRSDGAVPRAAKRDGGDSESN